MHHLMFTFSCTASATQFNNTFSLCITGGGGGIKSNQSTRSISPAMIPCGISDEQLVTLTVRELNKQLKMRGLNKEEMGTMKQR